MFITKKHISRRTMLRGMGAAVALPFMESMVPAQTPVRKTAAASPARLTCIEMVHGCAGSNTYGIKKNMWAPAAVGRDFDLTPSALLPLEPFRDYLTIISNINVPAAEAHFPEEVGGDHYRTACTMYTQAHPKLTVASDIYCGISLDQVYAQRFGQDTPIGSIHLSIESVDQQGGCGYGYSCVYTDSIAWASPTDPLPMVRDPRAVFEQLFGGGSTPEQRAARLQTDRSILDWIARDFARLKQDLSPVDRSRLNEYLDDIRDVEQRIHRIEAHNSSGGARELPDAPVGVPDSYDEHVKLMFDLQALAFTAGITRVSSFKMSRDSSGRVWPETGVRTGFHSASHHGARPARLEDLKKINTYHVSLIPYFLEKLKNTPDGDGSLLDHTLLIYGSAMGDSNLHNHVRTPLFMAGGGNGQFKGEMHVRAEDGTSVANSFLTVLHRLGLDDVDSFGDSTGELTTI
jgi:hypothetical protein